MISNLLTSSTDLIDALKLLPSSNGLILSPGETRKKRLLNEIYEQSLSPCYPSTVQSSWPSSSSSSSSDQEPGSPSSKRCRMEAMVPTLGTNSKVPASTVGLSTYSTNDVLSGRGGGTNQHEGNCFFRSLINENREKYLRSKKNDKPFISLSIVNIIRARNGRFLKKNEKNNLWYEIGDAAAREKTSQALRQRAPEYRKQIFERDCQALQQPSCSVMNTSNKVMNTSNLPPLKLDNAVTAAATSTMYHRENSNSPSRAIQELYSAALRQSQLQEAHQEALRLEQKLRTMTVLELMLQRSRTMDIL